MLHALFPFFIILRYPLPRMDVLPRKLFFESTAARCLILGISPCSSLSTAPNPSTPLASSHVHQQIPVPCGPLPFRDLPRRFRKHHSWFRLSLAHCLQWLGCAQCLPETLSSVNSCEVNFCKVETKHVSIFNCFRVLWLSANRQVRFYLTPFSANRF